jgi:hypothetical protein
MKILNGSDGMVQAIGSLRIISLGERVAIGYDATTGEHGFLVKLKNGTGGATVKGTVVSTNPSADNEFIAQANEYDAMGVVAVAGVAAGGDCWIWRHGSVCEALFENSVTVVRGYVAICSAVDGRATCIAVPSSNPAQGEHFKEIGHVAVQKTAGTNVLALIHFHTL